MARKVLISATINGTPQDFPCEPRTTLLEALREELGLMGTKEGCGNGNCGACTVLVDGLPVNSCLMLAVEAQGKAITTVEGLARPGRLHPVQDAFIEHGAFQCGFCTPGFLLSAVALLRRNPAPTEQEVRHGLAGNLCRCTGYDKIVRAVLAAAGAMAAAAPAPAGAAAAPAAAAAEGGDGR